MSHKEAIDAVIEWFEAHYEHDDLPPIYDDLVELRNANDDDCDEEPADDEGLPHCSICGRESDLDDTACVCGGGLIG